MQKGERPQVLGSGIVVSPRVVLTCAHVLSSGHSDFFHRSFTEDDLFAPDEIYILDGSTTYEAVRISCREAPEQSNGRVFSGDFCCVHFHQLPDLTPARLCRSRSVQGMKFRAAGFTAELLRPVSRIIPGIELIHGEHDANTGAVQSVQVNGGLPHGFSGAPVFASEMPPVVLGMLQLGGTTSTTSRFIAVDALAKFLAAQCPGIDFGDFVGNPEKGPESAGPPSKRGNVSQTVRTGDIINVGGGPFSISQNAWTEDTREK
jgi:hypothetical protein